MQVLPGQSTRGASAELAAAALLGLLAVALVACSAEPDALGSGRITSSEPVAGMTAEEFAARCEQRAGVVEDIPHCGGLNTCKGFSYDTTTSLLSEHSCKGAATCAGWNCIVD